VRADKTGAASDQDSFSLQVGHITLHFNSMNVTWFEDDSTERVLGRERRQGLFQFHRNHINLLGLEFGVDR
jgi:hypothetical protein